jgi:3-dehydroquinate dehydratase/shikimate dehydrogenase
MLPSAAPTRLICPLTAATIDAMRADMVAAKVCGSDLVECRLDYLSTPPDGEQLTNLFADAPLPLLVTCRPQRQGGRYAGPETRRLALLQAAARHPAVAFVDVEADSFSRSPESLDGFPPQKVILSHHDFARCPADLDAIAARLDASPAAISKIAFAASRPQDALRALDLLRSARKPTLALAMGEAGLLSRVLAKKFGAFGTFASLAAGRESAPGQPTLAEIKRLYRWDRIGPETAILGVIGCPVAHSMSPAVHNAAFEATGFNGLYLPLQVAGGEENFRCFLDAVRRRPWLEWRGLSVTIPHKQNALAAVGASRCDELSVRIGAINTITFDPDGALRGTNSDYAGAIDALAAGMGVAREQLAGRAAAVLGAGGAARAVVAALRHVGANVTVYNRTVAKAEALAREFACAAASPADAARTDAEILVNCTSLGMAPNVEACPLASIPSAVRVVFDTVYNPRRTRLLALAKDAGLRTVSGLDMFVNQAAAQFEAWTGTPAPRDVMRTVAGERL